MIVAGVMMLDFWRDSGAERLGLCSAFAANVAIIGGLLFDATARRTTDSPSRCRPSNH